jgi:hypothetical protein
MDFSGFLASSYGSGYLVGRLFVPIVVAALILHFWKKGPSKEELARRQAPAQAPRTLSTYGQPVEQAPAPPPVAAAPVKQTGGRPAWAAPVVWGLAALAAIAIIVNFEDPESFTKADQRNFVRGCTAAAGGYEQSCKCVLDQLLAKGYDTKDEMLQMQKHIEDATAANSPQSMPPDVIAAYTSCAPQQQPQG